MKRLAIIGSGDLALQIAHHAIVDNHYRVIGCFDDYKEEGDYNKNLLILGKLDTIESCYKNDVFDVLIIGIGYNHMVFRNELFMRFNNIIPWGTIVHSSSQIDSSAIIGSGTIIYPGCNFDMNVEIGENCLIYNSCIVAHDSKIANNSILSPGVNIAGFCSIGENTNFGIGTIISDNLEIVSNVRTGAGAVLVNSISESGLYVGIPAKKVK
jgi:sugar O-acyltransferase (sialic acid O-acetyltransferase NeuD family)